MGMALQQGILDCQNGKYLWRGRKWYSFSEAMRNNLIIADYAESINRDKMEKIKISIKENHVFRYDKLFSLSNHESLPERKLNQTDCLLQNLNTYNKQKFKFKSKNSFNYETYQSVDKNTTFNFKKTTDVLITGPVVSFCSTNEHTWLIKDYDNFGNLEVSGIENLLDRSIVYPHKNWYEILCSYKNKNVWLKQKEDVINYLKTASFDEETFKYQLRIINLHINDCYEVCQKLNNKSADENEITLSDVKVIESKLLSCLNKSNKAINIKNNIELITLDIAKHISVEFSLLQKMQAKNDEFNSNFNEISTSALCLGIIERRILISDDIDLLKNYYTELIDSKYIEDKVVLSEMFHSTLSKWDKLKQKWKDLILTKINDKVDAMNSYLNTISQDGKMRVNLENVCEKVKNFNQTDIECKEINLIGQIDTIKDVNDLNVKNSLNNECNKLLTVKKEILSAVKHFQQDCDHVKSMWHSLNFDENSGKFIDFSKTVQNLDITANGFIKTLDDKIEDLSKVSPHFIYFYENFNLLDKFVDTTSKKLKINFNKFESYCDNHEIVDVDENEKISTYFLPELDENISSTDDLIGTFKSLDNLETIKIKMDKMNSSANDIDNMFNEMEYDENGSIRSLDQMKCLNSNLTNISLNKSNIDSESDRDKIDTSFEKNETATNVHFLLKQLDNVESIQNEINDNKVMTNQLTDGMEKMKEYFDNNNEHSVILNATHRVKDLSNKFNTVDLNATNLKQKISNLLYSNPSNIEILVDKILNELEKLNFEIKHVESLPVNLIKISNEIENTECKANDLKLKGEYIKKYSKQMYNLNKKLKNYHDKSLNDKLNVVENYRLKLEHDFKERLKTLRMIFNYAQKYFDVNDETTKLLKKLNDKMDAMEPISVESAKIVQQTCEMKNMENRYEKANLMIADCRRVASKCYSYFTETSMIKIEYRLKQIDENKEILNDKIEERKKGLMIALELVTKYEKSVEEIEKFFLLAEKKLESLKKFPTQIRTLGIHMDELKMFKLTVQEHFSNIHMMNESYRGFIFLSPTTADLLTEKTKLLNNKWNKMTRGITDVQENLDKIYGQLVELDDHFDHTYSYIEELESSILLADFNQNGNEIYAVYYQRLKEFRNELNLQEKVINNMQKVVSKIDKMNIDRSSPRNRLDKKFNSLCEFLTNVKLMLNNKIIYVIDLLSEIKQFELDVHLLYNWMIQYRKDLSSYADLGCEINHAKMVYGTFQSFVSIFNDKCEKIQNILNDGEDICNHCNDGDSQHLYRDLDSLKNIMIDLKDRTNSKQVEFEKHLHLIAYFDDKFDEHELFMKDLFQNISLSYHVSKIVKTVLKQIESHKLVIDTLDEHYSKVCELEKKGGYLKYNGGSYGSFSIKKKLLKVKMSWRRVYSRAHERTVLLNLGYKEDVRFENGCKEMFEFIQTLSNNIDTQRQLEKDNYIEKSKEYENSIYLNRPKLHVTLRIGRSLRDRCTVKDHERGILNDMISNLKGQWCILRSKIMNSQHVICTSLINSGQYAAAIASIYKWLYSNQRNLTSIEDIESNQGVDFLNHQLQFKVGGDVETVNNIDRIHNLHLNELDIHKQTVFKLENYFSTNDHEQGIVDSWRKLIQLWSKIKLCMDLKSKKIETAKTFARQFQERSDNLISHFKLIQDKMSYFKSFRNSKKKKLSSIEVICEDLSCCNNIFKELQVFNEKYLELEKLSESIYNLPCNPSGYRSIKIKLSNIQNSYTHVMRQNTLKKEKLQESVDKIKVTLKKRSSFIGWLQNKFKGFDLSNKKFNDLLMCQQAYDSHLSFHEELNENKKYIEDIITFEMETNENLSSNQTFKETFGICNEEDLNVERHYVHHNWQKLWRLSNEKIEFLKKNYNILLDQERYKNFDMPAWAKSYNDWLVVNKSRASNIFRSFDQDEKGSLSRSEFNRGISLSGFNTNNAEINAVFDFIEESKSGFITFAQFKDALKLKRKVLMTEFEKSKLLHSRNKIINDLINKHTSACKCKPPFLVKRMSEFSYQFGKHRRNLKFYNKTNSVFIRVGGGFVDIDQYLKKHDPCRMNVQRSKSIEKLFKNLNDDKSERSINSIMNHRLSYNISRKDSVDSLCSTYYSVNSSDSHARSTSSTIFNKSRSNKMKMNLITLRNTKANQSNQITPLKPKYTITKRLNTSSTPSVPLLIAKKDEKISRLTLNPKISDL
ncbi:hypothetical protein A3Q56_06478 [Intoshia linei]|uniref:Uncharacterized protein n=1 Tax=Intoshia linei TaxID=1819745 RepID=A0A177AUX0_9BILA|nr:hypothetical protein A3Q56_06478 [Intoshia linei]